MDSKAVASVISSFAAKFCHVCNQEASNTSMVTSPLSAEFVLALLTLGTSDPSHKELLKALGLPDDDAVRGTFSQVTSQLRSMKGVTLNVANKVYLPEGPYELQQAMQKDVKVFDAGIEKVNFKNSAAAVKLINEWVEHKTNHKIKDLLSEDSVDDTTRLVLVNALYFKGSWKKKFDVNMTRDLPFHINSQTTVDVPMMYKQDKYKYGESQDLKAQLLQLPYEGDDASMLIVLPFEVEGLAEILKKLANGYDLISELNEMHEQKVSVTIPKFKIETEIDLTRILPKLGINAIFDKTNSGLDKLINTPEPLYVSTAVQKAFIEVNEEGAEAAAATVTEVRARRSLDPEFLVDRPALWCMFAGGHLVFAVIYRPTTPPPPSLRDEL